MTGIERLREFVAGISPITVVCGVTRTAYDREHMEVAGARLRDFLADIADQIERESDVETVRSEAMEAWRWVCDHGGLDHVKAEWRSRVPYDRYERRRQRLLNHIAECETALGRRNERISELEGLLKAFTNENAELRRRAMPESIEWPRYESGELVQFGDDVSRHGEDFEVNVIALYRNGRFSLNFWAYSKGERVKRPAVLAADGEPLEAGQTVWDTNGDELVIGAFEDGGHTVACRYADVGDGIPTHGMWSPSDLTHQRPVPDADGVPIKKGDTVYGTVEGGPFIVTDVSDKGSVFVDVFPDTGMHGSMLTHTKPEIDTWERIEEDARLKPLGYVDRVLGWDMSKSHSQNQARSAMTHDLVRRAKALAERERGE